MVVREEKRGGLGIGLITVKNKSFLFKWLW
jgi:hypothetical protein